MVTVFTFDGAGKTALQLGHIIAHVRALGDDGALIGTDGWHLHVSLIAAQGGSARVTTRYTLRDAVPKLDGYRSVMPIHARGDVRWIALEIVPTHV